MNIGQIVNQNSYAISAAILVLVIGSRVARDATFRSLAAFALLAAALVLPVLWVRSAQTPAAEIDGALGSGMPVLLELYSDL